MDAFELQMCEIRTSDTTGVAEGEMAAWAAAPWVTIGSNFQENEFVLCVFRELAVVVVVHFSQRLKDV